MSDAILQRAFRAHLSKPGAMQPSARSSAMESTANGRQYAVLRNSCSVLAVYRLLPSGSLKRLKRWPAPFSAEAA